MASRLLDTLQYALQSSNDAQLLNLNQLCAFVTALPDDASDDPFLNTAPLDLTPSLAPLLGSVAPEVRRLAAKCLQTVAVKAPSPREMFIGLLERLACIARFDEATEPEEDEEDLVATCRDSLLLELTALLPVFGTGALSITARLADLTRCCQSWHASKAHALLPSSATLSPLFQQRLLQSCRCNLEYKQKQKRTAATYF